jgi:hypothetical protein
MNKLLICCLLASTTISYQINNNINNIINDWVMKSGSQIEQHHQRRAMQQVYSNRRAETETRKHCDIAIIGGGSSGSHFAMFAMDKNYSVCVFEMTHRLGGHCDTQEIPGFPDWIDIGVAFYRNSSHVNYLGLGNYSLDMASYISRYTTIIPFPAFNGASWDEDIENGDGLSFVPPLTPEYQQNVLDFVQEIHANYPFLEDSTYPPNMPEELTISIEEFFDANYYNITRFERQFMQSMFSSAMSPLDKIPMIYAFKQLSPSIMLSSIEGNLFFGMFGGCKSVYDSIMARLQNTTQQSLFLNATITKVTRPEVNSNGVSTVHFKLNNGRHQKITADKIVIAIPQFIENLEFLDLDDQEKAVFEKVEYSQGYFALQLEKHDNTTFSTILNRNFNNTEHYFEPSFPAVTFQFPGSSKFYTSFGVSIDDISDEEMRDIIENNLLQQSLLPNPVNMSLVKMIRHIYFPHFNGTTLRDYNPYEDLKNLQNRRNCFFVGQLPTYPDSTWVANYCYELVRDYL